MNRLRVVLLLIGIAFGPCLSDRVLAQDDAEPQDTEDLRRKTPRGSTSTRHPSSDSTVTSPSPTQSPGLNSVPKSEGPPTDPRQRPFSSYRAE